MPARDVIVVGGGVIGLAAALRAAQHGYDVLLLERGLIGSGTSCHAAGMIAPVSEVDPGPAGLALLELCRDSAGRWPAFAQELEQLSGLPSQLRSDGTLLLARDADEAAALERELAFREQLGLPAERLLPSEARRREPALAPTLRLAVAVDSELSVDPTWLLAALEAACRTSGVEIRCGVTVEAVAERGGRVVGVRARELHEAEQVVIACGAWSAQLRPCPVRPVKGQLVRLRDPGGPGLLGSMVRFEGGYVVGRGDGRYVLGATVEERGYDAAVMAGAVYELLRDAGELVPGLLELELEGAEAAFRPGTPDNLPLLGPGDIRGLHWATGHYRNGILLTPLSGDLILASLRGEELPPACAPDRLVAA